MVQVLSVGNAVLQAPFETTGVDNKVTVEECRAALNPEFVKAFDNTKLDPALLRDFTLAADFLDEIITTSNFVSDRLLNTPDIERYGDDAVNAFNDKARSGRFPVRLGISVTSQVMELIAKFLDAGYPAVINKVLRALRVPGVDVIIDGEPCFIGITAVTQHPEFGIISYQDLHSGVNTSIPFLLQRLEA